MTRILVADDDPAIVSLIRRGLSYEGYEVETAADGPEALAKVKESRPDALILDVMMPGLDSGADDYLVKPFDFDELLARIRALLRRGQPKQEETLRFADLTLDAGTMEVRRGGEVLELTAQEFKLLEFFMRHPRQVLNRDQIYENVWGYDFAGESNVIEVYVRYLRSKLEAGEKSRLLHTVRGAGYALRD